MLAALLKGLVQGLFGGLFQWLDRRKAEQDRNKAQALDAALKGEHAAQLAERKIEDAAKQAKDSASTDFTTLR